MRSRNRLTMIAELRAALGGLLHRLLSSKRSIGTKGPIMREVKRIDALNAAIGETPTEADFQMEQFERVVEDLKTEHLQRSRPVITIRNARSEQIVQNLINWINSRGGGVGDLAEITGTDMLTAVRLWDAYYPTTTGPHPRSGQFSYTPIASRREKQSV